MSESKTPERPPQVTMAGWVTVAGSVFMLISIYTYVSQLRSIQNREAVAESLDRAPFSSMGLDLEQALSFLHTASLVGGACAAAAAILGGFVLQRNHQARIGLSVLILPLFFAGLVISPFLASMIGVSVVILWGRPSRDWFNGIAPQPPVKQQRAATQQVGPRAFEGFGKSPSSGTPPVSPSAPPPDSGPDYGPASQPADQTSGHSSLPWSDSGSARQPDSGLVPARPAAVLQACIITWVLSAVVLLGMVIVVIGFSVYPDLITDVYDSDSRFADSEITPTQLKQASLVLATMFIIWSAIAIGLAAFAFRGHNWARITLIVSAAMAGLLSLVMVVTSPALLVVTAACIGTVVSLSLRPAREWYARKAAARRQ